VERKRRRISTVGCMPYSITIFRDWCSSRRLQLKALKTELQGFGSRADQRKLSSAELTLSVGSDVIQPVTVVRDFGVYLDNELAMKLHISRVVSSCFFQLRRMRRIRRSAGEEVTKRLVTSLLLSHLDYCNTVLTGLSESTISSDALTLAADKITNSLQTVPPAASHSHQPATCPHGRDGWTHCNIFVAVWPPVCQPPPAASLPPVPDTSAENQVWWATLQSCRPGFLEQSLRLHSVWVKHYINMSRNFSKCTCLHCHFNSFIYCIVCHNMKCPPASTVISDWELDVFTNYWIFVNSKLELSLSKLDTRYKVTFVLNTD